MLWLYWEDDCNRTSCVGLFWRVLLKSPTDPIFNRGRNQPTLPQPSKCYQAKESRNPKLVINWLQSTHSQVWNVVLILCWCTSRCLSTGCKSSVEWTSQGICHIVVIGKDQGSWNVFWYHLDHFYANAWTATLSSFQFLLFSLFFPVYCFFISKFFFEFFISRTSLKPISNIKISISFLSRPLSPPFPTWWNHFWFHFSTGFRFVRRSCL